MFRQTFGWNELERLRRDMDRLVETSFPRIYRQRTRTYPAINIWSKESEGVIVTAELPGLSAEDIDISVTADTLTLSGKCQPSANGEREKYHRRERSYGEFNRVVQLPFNVDTDKVEASVEKGVLRVELPRAEAEKPRQIAVKASA